MSEERHLVYSVPEIFPPIEAQSLGHAFKLLKEKLDSLQHTADIAQYVGVVCIREISDAVTLPDKTKATVREYITITGFVLAINHDRGDGGYRHWLNTNFDVRHRSTPGAGTGR